jgi:hypothetical protein
MFIRLRHRWRLPIIHSPASSPRLKSKPQANTSKCSSSSQPTLSTQAHNSNQRIECAAQGRTLGSHSSSHLVYNHKPTTQGLQPKAYNPRLTTQTRSSRPKLELAVTLTTQANKAMNGILPTATSASIRSSTGDQAKYSLDLEGEKEKNDLNKSFSKPPIQTTRCWTHTHNASRTETSQRNTTKPAQLDIATSLPPSSNTGR